MARVETRGPVRSPAAAAVDAVAVDMLGSLARAFPVTSASDEFYWFPQVTAPEPDWATWDELSADAAQDLGSKLGAWEHQLENAARLRPDPELAVDIALLLRAARGLRQEVCEVRFWEHRPTVFLSVLCFGLTEAMDSEDPGAWPARVTGVPAFLDRAAGALRDVPELFRDMGLSMVATTRSYLGELEGAGREGLGPCFDALDRFGARLREVQTRPGFRLPWELAEAVVLSTVDSAGSIEEIEVGLEEELAEAERAMAVEAKRIAPSGDLDEALSLIPHPALPPGGMVALYAEQVHRLAEHCLRVGLASEDLVQSCPVRVGPVPAYLLPIRAGSSYTIPPGSPPRGGFFGIVDAGEGGRPREDVRECPILASHETYPGHHLLDASRWRLERAVRRPLERPLFYEGWACFAETLMERTGFLSGPADRLLLSRRRQRRAIRGEVDLALQLGTMDLDGAARRLAETGLDRRRTPSLVRRYLLNPGYQLCYSIGLRFFLGLYADLGGNDPGGFADAVLGEGEIGLRDLEGVLRSRRAAAGDVPNE